MRRNARRFAAAAIVVLAIGVPALLVWRTLPPQTEWQVVAADSGTPMPVELAADGGTRSLTVDTPRFPSVSDARVEVIVATYGRAPSRTIRLDLRDASGKTLRSCRIAPADYRDNGPVACPVDRPDRVRHV